MWKGKSHQWSSFSIFSLFYLIRKWASLSPWLDTFTQTSQLVATCYYTLYNAHTHKCNRPTRSPWVMCWRIDCWLVEGWGKMHIKNFQWFWYGNYQEPDITDFLLFTFFYKHKEKKKWIKLESSRTSTYSSEICVCRDTEKTGTTEDLMKTQRILLITATTKQLERQDPTAYMKCQIVPEVTTFTVLTMTMSTTVFMMTLSWRQGLKQNIWKEKQAGKLSITFLCFELILFLQVLIF